MLIQNTKRKGPIFIGRDTPSLRARFSPLDSVSDVWTEDRVVYQLMFAIEALLESIRVPVQDLEELYEQSEDCMGFDIYSVHFIKLFSQCELAPFGTRMASSQAVRNRMKSVKSIQKITKAMKMVAASKLRGIQSKTENSRGFWQPFVALMGDHPDIDSKKNVVFTLSSDKGLCGGINSTSVKLSKGIFKLSESEEPTKYIVMGEKGKVQLQRDSKKSIQMISMIADEIMKNVEFDVIRVVYNKFASVVSFLPSVATIMSPEIIAKESEAGGKLGQLESYEIEGADSKAEVLQNLSEFQFAATVSFDNLESMDKPKPYKEGGQSVQFDTFSGFDERTKVFSFLEQFDKAFEGRNFTEASKVKKAASFLKGNASQ
ncbi:hypothetical protein L7F22_039789 [Adiantum nelumboides]|nr:hypothetical protein [Adiantum nelumboides]